MAGEHKNENLNLTGIVSKISTGSKPEFKASLRAANAPKGVKLMQATRTELHHGLSV